MDANEIAPALVRYRVAGLAKGLAILSLFGDRRPRLRLKEITELTGFPMPTAFRLVATLEEAGYLERLSDGSLRPGIQVLELGFTALAGSDLRRAATPVTHELARTTGRTVNLGTLHREDVIYVIRHRTDDLVTENLTVGSTLPAPYTSMGKVLLAGLDTTELDAVIATLSFPPGAGPNAIQSTEALRVVLQQVRNDGFAFQDEEVAIGLRSIAAPVRGGDGAVIAAVNLVCPASTTSAAELLRLYKEPVLEAAGAISRRLGFLGA